MLIHLRRTFKILAVLMALGLAQCAKKTRSQDVVINPAPDRPIVFTSDYTTVQNGAPVTKKGPWFQFTLSIQNKADMAVTILAVHLEIEGVDENNQPKTVKMDFTPGENNFSNNDVTCNYFTFGTFPKNSTTSIQLVPQGSTDQRCLISSMYFVPTGTPKPANTAFIYYTVTIQPIGYFVDSDGKPADRFDNFTTVYTQ